MPYDIKDETPFSIEKGASHGIDLKDILGHIWSEENTQYLGYF